MNTADWLASRSSYAVGDRVELLPGAHGGGHFGEIVEVLRDPSQEEGLTGRYVMRTRGGHRVLVNAWELRRLNLLQDLAQQVADAERGAQIDSNGGPAGP